MSFLFGFVFTHNFILQTSKLPKLLQLLMINKQNPFDQEPTAVT